jgi:hypothetical protein
MEQVRATNTCEARQAACPARVRRRMRRNLVRASLNRMAKPRARQALCLLAGPGNHADVRITPEPRSSNSPPPTPEAKPVPIAAVSPSEGVSGDTQNASVGPVPGAREDRHDRDRPGLPTVQSLGSSPSHRPGRVGDSRPRDERESR